MVKYGSEYLLLPSRKMKSFHSPSPVKQDVFRAPLLLSVAEGPRAKVFRANAHVHVVAQVLLLLLLLLWSRSRRRRRRPHQEPGAVPRHRKFATWKIESSKVYFLLEYGIRIVGEGKKKLFQSPLLALSQIACHLAPSLLLLRLRRKMKTQSVAMEVACKFPPASK